ncbi:MAG: zinc ABC transporter substrate-binding protein [Bacteroidales bacterium]|nr:zinc ABC transporter substrate-binding protein [Bacteroidales bacterium]
MIIKFNSIRIRLVLIFIIGIFFGCSSSTGHLNKPVISVSILPQKYFVEKIAGDNFNINVLIPPGASPAIYEPSPKQVRDLANSKIYFKIGYIGFEKVWINKLEKNFNNVLFSDVSKGVNILEPGHVHHGSHNHPVEPHIWMSPLNVKIIANNIYSTLVEADPENKQEYNNRLIIFEKEIDSLHHFITNSFRNKSNRHFIIYHPALTYFANDYNLVQVPMEIEGKEPGVKHMYNIAKLAGEKNIKAILIQKEFNIDEANSLNEQINGEIIIIDPLDFNWNDQLLSITHKLNAVLK